MASPVKIMGVINVSPESFYKGSVASSAAALRRAAKKMAEDGADMIDIGAMSTAPYLTTEISEDEEARRIEAAVRAVRSACRLPISLDTSRRKPAEAGRRAGARILNDVTGLRRDPSLRAIAKKFSSVILMAHPSGLTPRSPRNPSKATAALLRESLSLARSARIAPSKIILDPGIGFFRTTGWTWWEWDLAVLKNLRTLRVLGHPILVGVSRKSLISHILGGRKPEERLAGSLGATVAAVLAGAALVRTHDVKETTDAVRMAEGIQAGRGKS